MAPVCSPTSTMLTTIGGKTPEASSGAVMVSPSLTLSWTLTMALLMTTLPAVSFTIVSACKMVTPLLTSVPSVRVKREMATLLMTGPSAGILSLNLSHSNRPSFVLLMISRNMITATTSTPSVSKIWSLMISLIPSTNVVNQGNVMFMPAKTSLNLGTTKTISKIMMPVATIKTAMG